MPQLLGFFELFNAFPVAGMVLISYSIVLVSFVRWDEYRKLRVGCRILEKRHRCGEVQL